MKGEGLLRWVGVAIPVLWFGILFAAGALRAGYDPIRQYMTELTVGENAWLAELAFFVVGPLVIAFALLLRREGAPPLGALLIAVKGVATIVSGLVVGDVDIGVRTTSGVIHNVSVLVGNLAMAGGIVIVALAWRRLVGYSIASAAVIIVSTALLATATPQGTGSRDAPLAAWAGLIQRISMLANYAWPAVVALAAAEALSRARSWKASRSASRSWFQR
jgi:hypothetical membrane protein